MMGTSSFGRLTDEVSGRSETFGGSRGPSGQAERGSLSLSAREGRIVLSAVAVVAPDSGVTYYDVPSEYGVHNYRYTVLNDRTVLVDPHTRRVVEVIN